MTDPDLRRAVRALALAARKLERATGDLTLAQYRVLALVAAGDERSSLVAERLAVAKPTITAVVDGLVERGCLTREAVAGDRRSLRLVVTPTGRTALADVEESMAAAVADVLGDARDPDAIVASLLDLDDALSAYYTRRLAARTARMSSQTLAPKPEKAAKPKGWVRRLITYMAPHKKHAYIAFGVAIGGQLIQSVLPLVQAVIIDDVITKHTRPLAPCNLLAPRRVVWSHDNKGALCRLVGGMGDPMTHIENRSGEPAANPYLYMGSQIVAGLDGMARRIAPGDPLADPYAQVQKPLMPESLEEAVDALAASTIFRAALGNEFIDHYVSVRRYEIGRFRSHVTEWEHREYFETF